MPARPQDRKSKAANLGDFEFEHNGETFTLPAFAGIKQGVIRRIRKQSSADFTFSLLEELCKDGSGYERSLEAIDDMDADQFERVNRGWMEHSEVDLGKSSGSST